MENFKKFFYGVVGIGAGIIVLIFAFYAIMLIGMGVSVLTELIN